MCERETEFEEFRSLQFQQELTTFSPNGFIVTFQLPKTVNQYYFFLFFLFFLFSYDIIETETQKHVVERHFSTHTVGCKVSNTTQFQTNNHASSSNPYIVNYFFNPKLQTMADKNGEDENCINSPGDEFKVRRKRNSNGDEKCAEKPIITSVQSMWCWTWRWWRCTTTKRAASAGSTPTASSLAARSGSSGSTVSLEDEACG